MYTFIFILEIGVTSGFRISPTGCKSIYHLLVSEFWPTFLLWISRASLPKMLAQCWALPQQMWLSVGKEGMTDEKCEKTMRRKLNC